MIHPMESAIHLLTGARPLSKNNATNAIRILEHKQKKFSKSSRIRILLFLFYLFGIKTINTLIHSCSSLENHTRFQARPKWAKCIPCGTYLGKWLKGVFPPPIGNRSRAPDKQTFGFVLRLFIYLQIYQLFIHLLFSNQRTVA